MFPFRGRNIVPINRISTHPRTYVIGFEVDINGSRVKIRQGSKILKEKNFNFHEI